MATENKKIVHSTATGHYISSDEFLKSDLSSERFATLKKSRFFKHHFPSKRKRSPRSSKP